MFRDGLVVRDDRICKRRAVAECPRFALDDRQIMAPIIDDFTRLTVGPIDDALMRADSLSLRDNNQPVRVNTKTDRAVRKAGRHAVTVALESDQACW